MHTAANKLRDVKRCQGPRDTSESEADFSEKQESHLRSVFQMLRVLIPASL